MSSVNIQYLLNRINEQEQLGLIMPQIKTVSKEELTFVEAGEFCFKSFESNFCPEGSVGRLEYKEDLLAERGCVLFGRGLGYVALHQLGDYYHQLGLIDSSSNWSDYFEEGVCMKFESLSREILDQKGSVKGRRKSKSIINFLMEKQGYPLRTIVSRPLEMEKDVKQFLARPFLINVFQGFKLYNSKKS